MAESWVRLWAGMTTDPKFLALSEHEQRVAILAHEIAAENRTCYPNWIEVESRSALDSGVFLSAFERLCDAGIVFSGFPSLLPLLADAFPLAPMFGPIGHARPSAEVWMRIRERIFARDDFTCRYCGARGIAMECDHVIPVAQGGAHDDSNLVTACRDCNRSKGARTPEQWRGA